MYPLDTHRDEDDEAGDLKTEVRADPAMTEPTEFSAAMDPPPASPGSSPYNRIKDKVASVIHIVIIIGIIIPGAQVKRKVGKELDKMTQELQEELDDNRKHVDNVRGVAHDLVEPETLQRSEITSVSLALDLGLDLAYKDLDDPALAL